MGRAAKLRENHPGTSGLRQHSAPVPYCSTSTARYFSSSHRGHFHTCVHQRAWWYEVHGGPEGPGINSGSSRMTPTYVCWRTLHKKLLWVS